MLVKLGASPFAFNPEGNVVGVGILSQAGKYNQGWYYDIYRRSFAFGTSGGFL